MFWKRWMVAALATLLAACSGDTPPETPPAVVETPPAVEAEPPAPIQAPWTDRQLVETPVQEDWTIGLLTGGYSIEDTRSSKTYKAPKLGSVQEQLYPVAPDRGHAFLELVSAEGPTIVVDYDLKWLDDEKRFGIEGKEVQAVDGVAHYTYVKDGDLYKRSE